MRLDDLTVAAEPSSPNAQLPLNSVEEFETFETSLQDPEKFGHLVMFRAIFTNPLQVRKLSSITALSAKDFIRKCLSHVISPKLAVLQSWRGVHGKTPFGAGRTCQTIMCKLCFNLHLNSPYD